MSSYPKQSKGSGKDWMSCRPECRSALDNLEWKGIALYWIHRKIRNDHQIRQWFSSIRPQCHSAFCIRRFHFSMLKVIKSFSFAWYTLSLILLLTEIEIFLYWILILLLQGKLPAPAVCTTYTVIHLAQTLLKCFKENGYRFNVKAIVTR